MVKLLPSFKDVNLAFGQKPSDVADVVNSGGSWGGEGNRELIDALVEQQFATIFV